MDFLLPIALVTGCAASGEDLWRMRVSNWTSGGAVAGGILYHCLASGWGGALTALLGALAGFGLFLPFYVSGGMGGGDVKLMAGFGSLLGAATIWKAAFLAAILGAILASAVWFVRRGRSEKLSGASIPYAPAICLGAWLALLGRSAAS